MSSTPSASRDWGGLLQEALDSIDLSQNRLAELLGRRQPTVNRWCTGVLRPGTDDQVRIYETLRDNGWPGTVTGLFPRSEDEADLAVRCSGGH